MNCRDTGWTPHTLLLRASWLDGCRHSDILGRWNALPAGGMPISLKTPQSSGKRLRKTAGTCPEKCPVRRLGPDAHPQPVGHPAAGPLGGREYRTSGTHREPGCPKGWTARIHVSGPPCDRPHPVLPAPAYRHRPPPLCVEQCRRKRWNGEAAVRHVRQIASPTPHGIQAVRAAPEGTPPMSSPVGRRTAPTGRTPVLRPRT